MFVGEVLAATEKEPLALHAGKYWKLTKQLPKPSQKEREKMQNMIAKAALEDLRKGHESGRILYTTREEIYCR